MAFGEEFNHDMRGEYIEHPSQSVFDKIIDQNQMIIKQNNIILELTSKPLARITTKGE